MHRSWSLEASAPRLYKSAKNGCTACNLVLRIFKSYCPDITIDESRPHALERKIEIQKMGYGNPLTVSMPKIGNLEVFCLPGKRPSFQVLLSLTKHHFDGDR